MLSADRERWAEVLAVERRHGRAAPIWIAERLAILSAEGDLAGVARFMEIACRLERLQAGSRAALRH